MSWGWIYRIAGIFILANDAFVRRHSSLHDLGLVAIFALWEVSERLRGLSK